MGLCLTPPPHPQASKNLSKRKTETEPLIAKSMRETRRYLVELALEELFEKKVLAWDGEHDANGHYRYHYTPDEILSLIGSVFQSYYPKLWALLMERDQGGAVIRKSFAHDCLLYVKSVIADKNKLLGIAHEANQHGLLGYDIKRGNLALVVEKMARIDCNAGSGMTQRAMKEIKDEGTKYKRICLGLGLLSDEDASLLSEAQKEQALKKLEEARLRLVNRRMITPCPYNMCEECKGNKADSFGVFLPCKHKACSDCVEWLYNSAIAEAADANEMRRSGGPHFPKCPEYRQKMESYIKTGATPPTIA